MRHRPRMNDEKRVRLTLPAGQSLHQCRSTRRNLQQVTRSMAPASTQLAEEAAAHTKAKGHTTTAPITRAASTHPALTFDPQVGGAAGSCGAGGCGGAACTRPGPPAAWPSRTTMRTSAKLGGGSTISRPCGPVSAHASRRGEAGTVAGASGGGSFSSGGDASVTIGEGAGCWRCVPIMLLILSCRLTPPADARTRGRSHPRSPCSSRSP